MRKLILGIIALVCLDIGFVAYTSADLQADLAVKKSPVPAPADVSIDSTAAPGPSAAGNTIDPSDVAAVKAESDDISNIRKSGRSSTERRMPVVKARPRMKERVLTARNQPLFTPIVFYVPRHSAVASKRTVAIKDTRDLKPAVEKQFTRYTPKTENRSLVARVWPVIKKPYEWIKVIGSKFN